MSNRVYNYDNSFYEDKKIPFGNGKINMLNCCYLIFVYFIDYGNGHKNNGERKIPLINDTEKKNKILEILYCIRAKILACPCLYRQNILHGLGTEHLMFTQYLIYVYNTKEQIRKFRRLLCRGCYNMISNNTPFYSTGKFNEVLLLLKFNPGYSGSLFFIPFLLYINPVLKIKTYNEWILYNKL